MFCTHIFAYLSLPFHVFLPDCFMPFSPLRFSACEIGWLENAEQEELARALTRLAQLNQTKVYLFWKSDG